jgi:pimeloyl-ACP methyl ester carboxylesterase
VSDRSARRTTPLSSGIPDQGKIAHVGKQASGPAAAGIPLTLGTADGERIRAVHLPRAGGSRDVAVVVAHGFNGGIAKPAVQAVARGLAPYAGLFLFDFRGHGGSSGRSTLGDREIYDIDAVVREARRLGYRAVVTCGWSMGSSVVLRHAALLRGVDAVVAVSGPSRWFVRDTKAMRRLMWFVESRTGRALCRLGGLRVMGSWETLPESPLEVVGRVAPVPLLIVHGDRDHYFGVEHARALAQAAGRPCELWVVPGMGHAETGASAELLGRIGRHIEALLTARSGASDTAGAEAAS